ncbi:MAG: MlaD family protein, partial [Thermoanaerobaculia bacterium]
MKPSPVRDLVVGLFVLVGLGAVGYLSLQVGGLDYRGPGGFILYATFDEIGGLKARAPVTISGVRVGQVDEIRLDADL